MRIGDLVRVHWGNADWSGVQDQDWGYSLALVTSEIQWWENNVRGSICGDVEVLFRGERVLYNLGRVQVVNESRGFGENKRTPTRENLPEGRGRCHALS